MGKHNPNGRYDEAEKQYIESVSAGHLDAAGSIFLARELNYVRGRALEVPKAPLKAFAVFPVQTDVPAGAETATQRVYDTVGMAKIISNYADDLPRADVLADEITVKLYDVGAAYGYNITEVRNAQFAGMNLDATKAKAVRRSIDEKLNRLAWEGDADYNIIGFLNNPNMSEVTLPADGTGSSTRFKDKTVAQIIRDMNSVIDTISNVSNEIEEADTVLLATDAYNHISATPRSDNSDITILEFLQRTHPEIRRWMKVGALNGAGTGGTDLVIAGHFEPDYVKFEIPERFRQLPVEKRNLEYVIDCISRAIGVTVIRPLAFSKAQGV